MFASEERVVEASAAIRRSTDVLKIQSPLGQLIAGATLQNWSTGGRQVWSPALVGSEQHPFWNQSVQRSAQNFFVDGTDFLGRVAGEAKFQNVAIEEGREPADTERAAGLPGLEKVTVQSIQRGAHVVVSWRPRQNL